MLFTLTVYAITVKKIEIVREFRVSSSDHICTKSGLSKKYHDVVSKTAMSGLIAKGTLPEPLFQSQIESHLHAHREWYSPSPHFYHHL